MNTVMESAIYSGKVHHKRHVPKTHNFEYNIFLYWLKLSELPLLTEQVRGFSHKHQKRSWVKFRRDDYLGNEPDLESSVKLKMSELNGAKLTGDIFFLGQARTLGMYFSPVNFYYLRQPNGVYSHVLAEVSNTPWNERHHYLVDLSNQQNQPKAFHVSPFNPMDMEYEWRIQQPGKNLKLILSCIKESKHFTASLDLERQELTSSTLRKNIFSIPSMTIKTVFGIYWQATKLFFKRVPIYTHQ